MLEVGFVIKVPDPFCSDDCAPPAKASKIDGRFVVGALCFFDKDFWRYLSEHHQEWRDKGHGGVSIAILTLLDLIEWFTTECFHLAVFRVRRLWFRIKL